MLWLVFVTIVLAFSLLLDLVLIAALMLSLGFHLAPVHGMVQTGKISFAVAKGRHAGTRLYPP